MSGPGRGSAVENLRSYGLVLSALAGAEALIKDGEAFIGSPTFSISDPNAAVFGAMAALAGALAAREDGAGRAIDLSQIEAAATLAGSPAAAHALLDATVQASDGSFVSVGVPSAAVRNRDSLAQALAGAPPAAIFERARALGGDAAVVLELDQTDAAAEFSDCPGWLASNHPYTGLENLVAAPWRINGRRPGLLKPAPLLGEGDDYVMRRVLGLTDDEADRLTAAGVVGTKATA